MNRFMREFLQNEQRALGALVDVIVGTMVLGFIAAVTAIILLR